MKDRSFISWKSMHDRCGNPNSTSYRFYGGRGISVCDRWGEFANFLEDMGTRPIGRSLDRIDNEKGYCKENCKWSTAKEQDNNRRSNNIIEFCGEKKTLEQWAERIGIPSNTLWMRLYRQGWSVERALTTPLAKNGGRFSGGWNRWAGVAR